jgi:hypothetical protein
MIPSDVPSFQEDHISQVPALQLLQNLGWQYLAPDEALELRGGKRSNVLLDDNRWTFTVGTPSSKATPVPWPYRSAPLEPAQDRSATPQCGRRVAASPPSGTRPASRDLFSG